MKRPVKGAAPSPLVSAGASVSEGKSSFGPDLGVLSPKAKSGAPPSSLRHAGNTLLSGAGAKMGLGTGTSPSTTPRTASSPSKSASSKLGTDPQDARTTTPLSAGSSEKKVAPLRMDLGAAESTSPASPLAARVSGGGGSASSSSRVPTSSAGTESTATPRGHADSTVTASTEVDDDLLQKFHSAIRWGKTWPEIEAVVGDGLCAACSKQDPKNGNYAVHIASQNGHLQILEKLVAAGSSVNVQNGKGQTPLHMSVEYDFYFASKFLLEEAGADRELANSDGHKAILGIDGGKTGMNAWDNGVTILKAAVTLDQINFALDVLEKAAPDTIDKGDLVQAGLMKKRTLAKDIWDHPRFMKLAANF